MQVAGQPDWVSPAGDGHAAKRPANRRIDRRRRMRPTWRCTLTGPPMCDSLWGLHHRVRVTSSLPTDFRTAPDAGRRARHVDGLPPSPAQRAGPALRPAPDHRSVDHRSAPVRSVRSGQALRWPRPRPQRADAGCGAVTRAVRAVWRVQAIWRSYREISARQKPQAGHFPHQQVKPAQRRWSRAPARRRDNAARARS